MCKLLQLGYALRLDNNLVPTVIPPLFSNSLRLLNSSWNCRISNQKDREEKYLSTTVVAPCMPLYGGNLVRGRFVAGEQQRRCMCIELRAVAFARLLEKPTTPESRAAITVYTPTLFAYPCGNCWLFERLTKLVQMKQTQFFVLKLFITRRNLW